MNTIPLSTLSYGLFVLTAKVGDKMNGCINNTVIQAASGPNQLAFAVNKANYTHDMLLQTKRCNISVLSEAADFELIKHFGFQSGRDVDKFADFKDFKLAENGIPYVTKGTNAYFSFDISKATDLESHTLFVGVPTAMEVLSDVPSATYAFYQANIKPKPTDSASAAGQTVWRCTVCGYEYVGDELPAEFICPLCKHPAEDFEMVVK